MKKNLIKESQLKYLVKVVLKEISLSKKPLQNIDDLLDFFSQKINDSRINNPKDGYKFTYQLINFIKSDIEDIIKDSIKNNGKNIEDLSKVFDYHKNYLFSFIGGWLVTFYRSNKDKKEEIGRIMYDIQNHVVQLSKWLEVIELNMVKYNNHINALKGIEHLNEIFESIKESVDLLFSKYELKKTNEKY